VLSVVLSLLNVPDEVVPSLSSPHLHRCSFS
jgi:hypothetical protein